MCEKGREALVVDIVFILLSSQKKPRELQGRTDNETKIKKSARDSSLRKGSIETTHRCGLTNLPSIHLYVRDA